jgi:phospholipase C
MTKLRLWLVLAASIVAGCGRARPGNADAGADAGVTVTFRTPIEHLVVVVLENHTFDNLFANFPGAHSASAFPDPSFPDGGLQAPVCPDALPRDLNHGHAPALTDWDQGKMDGWFKDPNANVNGDYMAWCQYPKSGIPGLWDLAENYALLDHFHSSYLGESFPGHLILLAGQAGWALGDPTNLFPWGCDAGMGATVPILVGGTCTVQNVLPCFNIPSAPDVLAPGMTWKFYGTNFFNLFIWTMFDAVVHIREGPGWNNIVPYAPNFDDDANNGTLPTVSWLVNQDNGSGHPPFSMCASDTWITTHVNEVINGPEWSSSAVIITWDDFGGFVDDVPPPVQYGCDGTQPYGLGFRLPAIIVSPWVKNGVFHEVTEQASVVRLIDELFSVSGEPGQLHAQDPAARDDTAGSLLDAFDFNQTPLPPKPAPTACP